MCFLYNYDFFLPADQQGPISLSSISMQPSDQDPKQPLNVWSLLLKYVLCLHLLCLNQQSCRQRWFTLISASLGAQTSFDQDKTIKQRASRTDNNNYNDVNINTVEKWRPVNCSRAVPRPQNGFWCYKKENQKGVGTFNLIKKNTWVRTCPPSYVKMLFTLSFESHQIDDMLTIVTEKISKEQTSAPTWRCVACNLLSFIMWIEC